MRYFEPNVCPVVQSTDVVGAARDRLRRAITDQYAGRVALVSSFGAEAVVLLHMVSEIDAALPVLLNETGMLFPETLDYQRHVSKTLGLSNVQLIRPDADELRHDDPDGRLHRRDADACCHLRKVAPLNRALKSYAAWITGRKRFQSSVREAMPFVERDEDGRTKFNPLADWSASDVVRYIEDHGLPRHPLVGRGYRSIGCAPCTSPVGAGEDTRAGRWRGQSKTECGIHIVDGRVVRQADRTLEESR